MRFGGLILSYFKWLFYEYIGFGVKDWICGIVIIIIMFFFFCGILSFILVFILCFWRIWKYVVYVKICEN